MAPFWGWSDEVVKLRDLPKNHDDLVEESDRNGPESDSVGMTLR